MEDFTREGLVSAYRNRQTSGTTGERIFLEVHAGDASMGDTLRTDEPFSIRAFSAGTAQVKAVRLYQGLTLIEEKSLKGAREGEVEFTGLKPHDIEKGYVVMVLQEDENRFWTGKPFTLINTLGMDFLITLGQDGPTTFNIECDEEQATWIGHEKRIGKTVTLALDGRITPGALPERAVVSLAPGARWIGPSENGYWAADPENKIIETDEDNNLLNF